ncbi:MAG: DNA mismatch repair protein MutS [Thermodesulfobacteriota bacterium]|nr:DNA mismatch repair protein MutS [Thermodesulfobacteriota bacterium]
MMNLTPAMKQYVEIKEEYKDCILFFRMGDFYEMFFEDAIVASKAMEITLTSRNKGKEDSIPLCGIPYHAAPSYIAKLIEKGFKVAICEQVEDPKKAKGIVKREVVRVVTPGLVVDTDNLQAKENNFLAGFSIREDTFGLAFVDISTGEFRVAESSDRKFFLNEITGLDFKEIIVEENLKESSILKTFSGCVANCFPSDYFDHDAAVAILREYFSEDVLAEIDVEGHPAMAEAAGAVLRYVTETQKDHLVHINDIKWYDTAGYLMLDDVVRRNLELFTTIADNTKSGSLFNVLDETTTAMGGRRLRWWFNYPLIDTENIRERLAAVSEIKESHLFREDLRKALSGVYDLERLTSRISMKVANGRDLIALKASLQALPGIRELLSDADSPLVSSIYEGIDEMRAVAALIEKSIDSDPPLALREGGIIKEGYDSELDELISLTRDGKRWIATLEEKERKRTGINSLKVGYNNVFGYYIEVTKTNTDLVPDDYIRKQTLVNAERYINQELKGYEYTILNAEDKRKEREYELFGTIRGEIAKEIKRIQKTASLLADLDAIVSLAEVAEKYNYCCPRVDDEDVIEIKDGRHPVVERMPLTEGFVPNDTFLDCDKNRFLIITGPNMAGKSTYIRQVALIVLMAQMGSFVPASEARTGIVDRIFTRVGATDSLARGQSTFMVEMNEVAHILKNATKKSLVLLDEVGRGTSTFDGLSIAWAVAEYIHDSNHIGARTLFATHYHHLTDMALTGEGIKNFNVAVKEWGDRIIFLRKIVEGGTNRSYGIQVARLAGVPEEVLLRAKEVLENLEKGELDEVGMPKIAPGKDKEKRGQLSLFIDEEDHVLNELKELNIDNMTPIEALHMINEWQTKMKGDK